MKRHERIALGACMIGVSAGLMSCAQNVGDVDRIQANYMAKEDFEGVWYYRKTVTDVPYQLDYTFIGYSSKLEKLRWDIREDFLVAYRSYELQPGTDPQLTGVDDPIVIDLDPKAEEAGFDLDGYKEEPVAAFRIKGHFDVQRQYNTATGEQTNVIVENYSDRLWDQRAYFRVDWSTNYVAELFFLTDMSSVASTSYFVQENEGGPDALHREMRPADEEEDGTQMAYFDFVNKVALRPEISDCWYYNLNCISGEIKIRHSFFRLEEDERDYEPALYDDRDMNKFGYFRTVREEYDRREGLTDTLRRFYAARHDIWQNDYKRDAAGQYLRDTHGRRIPTPMARSRAQADRVLPVAGVPGVLWSRAPTMWRATGTARSSARWPPPRATAGTWIASPRSTATCTCCVTTRCAPERIRPPVILARSRIARGRSGSGSVIFATTCCGSSTGLRQPGRLATALPSPIRRAARSWRARPTCTAPRSICLRRTAWTRCSWSTATTASAS